MSTAVLAGEEVAFGEPDLRVRPAGDGLLTVEVCGLDVYDPTTGVLRSSSVGASAARSLQRGKDFFSEGRADEGRLAFKECLEEIERAKEAYRAALK